MAYKQIERKPLTVSERLYLPAIASGLGLTLKHFFKKSVTMQYPEEKPRLPSTTAAFRAREGRGRSREVRGLLALRVRLPAEGHPDLAGEIESDVERGPEDFQINMLRCIFCGYCEEVCPEEAIFMTQNYEICGESREEMIHDKKRLYEIGGTDTQYKRTSGTKKWEGRGKVKTLEHLEGGH
jgi:NADH-quinone oxidoreductase subunit I